MVENAAVGCEFWGGSVDAGVEIEGRSSFGKRKGDRSQINGGKYAARRLQNTNPSLLIFAIENE